MSKNFALIIDFESMATTARAAMVSFAAVIVDLDPNVDQSFKELVRDGIQIKFDLASQKHIRDFDLGTIQWWKDQHPDARKWVIPSEEDLTITEGLHQLKGWMDNTAFRAGGTGLVFCRGQNFDIPALEDMIRTCDDPEIIALAGTWPCPFYKQRDIRSFIAGITLDPHNDRVPIRKGQLEGFVAHDCLHDVARDAILIKQALRYAHGIEDPQEETHEAVTW